MNFHKLQIQKEHIKYQSFKIQVLVLLEKIKRDLKHLEVYKNIVIFLVNDFPEPGRYSVENTSINPNGIYPKNGLKSAVQ